MFKKKIYILLISTMFLLLPGCTDKSSTHIEPTTSVPETKNQLESTTSEICSESFLHSLEKLELDQIGNGKHWRKGDYEPYTFLRCDIDGNRARLSYVREPSPNQDVYYLVYFTKIDNVWNFDFNDVVFISKNQQDGSKTTLKDVLKTRNEMYWLSSDKIK